MTSAKSLEVNAKFQHFQQKKIANEESAERGLQKADSTTWQYSYGMLKLQKLLLIVKQLFADTYADT